MNNQPKSAVPQEIIELKMNYLFQLSLAISRLPFTYPNLKIDLNNINIPTLEKLFKTKDNNIRYFMPHVSPSLPLPGGQSEHIFNLESVLKLMILMRAYVNFTKLIKVDKDRPLEPNAWEFNAILSNIRGIYIMNPNTRKLIEEGLEMLKNEQEIFPRLKKNRNGGNY